LLVTVTAVAQKFPRAVPESEGVSSRQISEFIQAWEDDPAHEPHSFMVLRHGRVVAEGWWKPFGADEPHTMYSASKSFTATGIGFAVHEGKIGLDDPVLSFFPGEGPVNPSDNLKKLRVRDLLTMSAGNDQEPRYMQLEDNWVSAFLRSNYSYEPGTRFMYNSPATYMLSAILQKVTGEKLLDYLTPRLLVPLGITGVDWEVDPHGINTGGWGLRLKTEDMAKFGQLFLQKGKWNGKQVLPEEWVKQASAAQIFPPEGHRENSDWHQGYGFQMWRGRHQTFRADGAFGQNIIVLPEKDAVIITTGESTNLQGLLNLIWDKLLPAFKDGKLKKDPAGYQALAEKSKNLLLTPQKSEVTGNTALANLVFIQTPYNALKGLKLERKNEDLEVTFVTDSVNHTIPFSDGRWALSETTLKGPYLVAGARANRSVISRYKVAGSYGWKDSHTLVLVLKYYDTMHTETITVHFNGEEADVSFNDITTGGPKTYKAVEDRSQGSSPRLILRGDDMGYSHSGNLALLKSSQQGIQTSIEVIAAAPWFPEAVRMLQENPGIDVGLHFAITSEWDNVKWRPLTEAKSLRNADGYFYPMIMKNSYYRGQAIMDHAFELRDIEAELRAQIGLLKKHIPRVSHISGHMGSTMFTPEVKAMVRKVAAEYGLPVVDSDALKDFGIEYIWIDSRNKSSEERIDAFIRQLDKLENHKTYVFLEHPGLDNEELRAIHHIGYENVAEDRQAVTDLFTSEKVRRAIYRKGIRLVSYREALGK